jgi:pimeloyl-ACP methyl ester carboxylesterase
MLAGKIDLTEKRSVLMQQIDRRQLGKGVAYATTALLGPEITEQPTKEKRSPLVVNDGAKLFVQDWGQGRPIVFLSAWTFHSNVWGSYISALTARGFRCVAPDRRGHGRSEAPNYGYDLDTLVGDLAAVIEHLDLRNVVLVAHSMGSIEAVRYCAGPGAKRVSRLVLAAPVTPFILQTNDNPEGVPGEFIEAQHQAIATDFPRWMQENEEPFFTPDTPKETRTWIKTMMLSIPLPVALACNKTISTADLREDVRKVACPTLIVQGDKDASAPLAITGQRTARMIPHCKLLVYPGAPHGIVLTHQQRFLSDLLAFIG